MEKNLATQSTENQETPKVREPLPVYSFVKEPPVFEQTEPEKSNHPSVKAKADSAFVKAILSLVFCLWPITSIVAIFFGNGSVRSAEKANYLAAFYGGTPGSKVAVAKIMGRIGFIIGIAATAFWAVYTCIYLYLLFIIEKLLPYIEKVVASI